MPASRRVLILAALLVVAACPADGPPERPERPTVARAHRRYRRCRNPRCGAGERVDGVHGPGSVGACRVGGRRSGARRGHRLCHPAYYPCLSDLARDALDCSDGIQAMQDSVSEEIEYFYLASTVVSGGSTDERAGRRYGLGPRAAGSSVWGR